MDSGVGYEDTQRSGRAARTVRTAKQLGFNRLRWGAKAQTVRRYGKPVSQHLRYVLIDPETDNFTYEIENYGELAVWLDELFGAGQYVSELREDTGLALDLRRRVRWRPAAKRRALFGRRIGWY